MPRAVDPAILTILADAELDGDLLVLKTQLDRDEYVRVDKVLKSIGAKWNRSKGGHVLTEPESRERFEALLAEGKVEPIDKMGYFPTPERLVDLLVDLADVHANHTVLEPSAGRGAIVERVLQMGVAPENLWAVEIQPKHAEHLSLPNLLVEDFMAAEFPLLFDRVVMNPPFERQQDIDHVTKAFSLLAPGGKLVSVMGAGALTGERRKNIAFADLVGQHGYHIPNAANSFKASGTAVNTITVILDK